MSTAVVPVVFYNAKGDRIVIGEATVSTDDYPLSQFPDHEINLNDAGLSPRKDR